MKDFNSLAAEAEFKEATNNEKRIALINKLIAALKFHEENPEEAAKIIIVGLKDEIADLKNQVTAAELTALDALDQVNNQESGKASELTAKVEGKTYIILFGVDGLTKEQLKEDSDKIKELVKKGSGAVQLKED